MFPNGAIEHACIAVHPRTGVIVIGEITSGTRLAYSTDGGANGQLLLALWQQRSL